MLQFPKTVQLVVSDVDDTLAHPYCAASPAITMGLNALLARGLRLFLITGQSTGNLAWRVVDHIEPRLRRQILLGTCSGAEVWGYDAAGELLPTPFYSVYEERFTSEQKTLWRKAIRQVIEKFGLRPHATRSKQEFYEAVGCDVFDMMYEDRSSQITFEMCNACALTDAQRRQIKEAIGLEVEGCDLRPAIIVYANELFGELGLPVSARLAGNVAIDFAVIGATKRIAVEFGLFSPACETYFGVELDSYDEADLARRIEVWGDKFSLVNGGTDRHICEALPVSVRAIDFRREDPGELPQGYNICIWDGEHELCDGVAEYLSRHAVTEARDGS